jgi:homoserine kinase
MLNLKIKFYKIYRLICNQYKKMFTKVSVKSCATIANVVCGFDVLGFAVDNPTDEFVISFSNTKGVTIINLDEYNLPTNPIENICGVALQAMLNVLPSVVGFKIVCNKKIKPGSGLGSSSSSAAGVVVAANHLLGNIFTKEELVEFALEGEALASGSKHADNIAPTIYGGFTLIRSLNPLDIISIDAPPLFVSIIHPQIEVKTSEARKILPGEISLKLAIEQWGNLASLIAGLQQHDYALISRSLKDVVVEPYRSQLIPYYYEVKNAALQAGALGGGIAGSGPTVFMFSQTEAIAIEVEKAMQQVYSQTSIPFNTYVSQINKEGVKIVEAE